jgi:hypothetical protein
MASNRKSTKKRDSNQVATTGTTDEAQAIARTVLQPTVLASATIKEYDRSWGDLDLSGLTKSLTEQTSASSHGDLTRAETMLTAQAHTLDAIFNTLARRAIKAEYMDHLDRYLKLALRAQSQCRATWEALGTIKNPPVMGYVRQANIAHGPQQVNNASPIQANTSRAGEHPNVQNKLLEANDGQRLDPGATCTPG